MEGDSAGLITIDGSKGEGGGQIIRNAISYANILRKKIRILNIRSGRAKPGLQAQHVTGLQLASAVSGGSLIGDRINSTEIRYQPAPLPGSSAEQHVRSIRGEIKSAGSICLLLQAALPCALFSPTECHFHLTGGTDASFAPQYNYWYAVFRPTLQTQCGLSDDQIQADVTRRGFFPKGGGKVQVRVKPLTQPLRPVQLTERGTVTDIFIRTFHAGAIPRTDAESIEQAARTYLEERVNRVNFHTEIVTETKANGSSMGILIVAITDTGCRLAGSSVLAKPKKSAQEIGFEAAEELFQTMEDGGCVDEWLQDQLILFAALADGVSEILTGSLTLHTRTAIMIAEEMAGAKFEVTKLPDKEGNKKIADDVKYGKEGRISGRHLIRCHGIGLQSFPNE